MKIVNFYLGLQGNQNGDTYDEIMRWSDSAWDCDHDFVQWLYPLTEPSGIHGGFSTLQIIDIVFLVRRYKR